MIPIANFFIRLVGGDAATVRLLNLAMRKNAQGRRHLLYIKSDNRFVMSANGFHQLTLVFSGLISVILMLVVIFLGSQGHPPYSALILVSVHLVFVAIPLVGQIVPALLCDDDARILGWWPLSRRDLILARMTSVLLPTLQTTLVLISAPILAYLFIGRPYFIGAILLTFGILIQTFVVVLGAGGLTAWGMRLLGQRKARNLAALLVDNNLALLPLVFLVFMEPLSRWATSHPEYLGWLPPVWFAAFGDPSGGIVAWRRMALATILSVVVGIMGWRLASAGGMAPAAYVLSPEKVYYSPADLFPMMLCPWMRGREGWVVRRLLTAHLREDWRFRGNMFLVAMAVTLLWLYALHGSSTTEMGATWVSAGNQILFILTLTFPFLASFSSKPQALWIVALADLDSALLLVAQRGMMRGLIAIPVLAVVVVRGMTLHVQPMFLVISLAVFFCEVEIILVATQRFQPLMVFSRNKYGQSSSRVVMSMGIMLMVGVVNLVTIRFRSLWPLLLIGLLIMRWFLHRGLERKVKGSRLNFAEIIHS